MSSPFDPCGAMQSRKAVSAYFSSKHSLPFGFAGRYGQRQIILGIRPLTNLDDGRPLTNLDDGRV